MAVTLTAANTPAPVVPNPGVLLSDSNAPPVSDEFSTGVSAGFTTQLNKQFKRADLMGSYGSGAYGVADGLTLTAGTGLVCNVAAGHAVIDGVVERSATTIVVAASSTNWIWLKQDGTLVSQDDTTAKPSGNCVLLGAAITDGSGVTSIETAGVCYFRSGVLWRETADAYEPTDTPNSAVRIWTKTSGGDYFWNGSRYVEALPVGSPKVLTQTLSYTAFSTAGTQVSVNAFNLPAKAIVQSVHQRVSTVFAGPSITAADFDFGYSGAETRYVTAQTGLTAASVSSFTGWQESTSGTTQTQVRATSGGANLDQLTAGEVVVSLVLSKQG